ncbi:MAG: glycosyltransferase family 2 protein [Bacteroidia bacterium]|nr:glycosyltransferase family 2 protein [Bacteroidia bacterium]
MQVSLVITSYNYARYIERAIRSAMDQSLPKNRYEIIVVDDCSTDKTRNILENYRDEIRLVYFDENKGLAAARNEGIKRAKGMYVVFLDADDYLQHDLLKIQSVFLNENNKLDAVSVDYYLVNEIGDHIELVSAKEKPIACGVMFRKDRLFDIGLYDEKFQAREEEDLRIRFLKKYEVYNIILPLYRYRRHADNLTNNAGKMKEFKKMLKTKHKKK